MCGITGDGYSMGKSHPRCDPCHTLCVFCVLCLSFRHITGSDSIIIWRYQIPTIEDKMKTLLWNQQEALVAHKLARSRMADQWRSTFTPFKKGDQVWLDSRNLKTVYIKKMKPKWEGPFLITKVPGPVTYRLKLLTSWQIHNVFHATLLKPYRENEIYRGTSLNHLLN